MEYGIFQEYSKKTLRKLLEFGIFLKYSIFQKSPGFSCCKFVDLFFGREEILEFEKVTESDGRGGRGASKSDMRGG